MSCSFCNNALFALSLHVSNTRAQAQAQFNVHFEILSLFPLLLTNARAHGGIQATNFNILHLKMLNNESDREKEKT